MTAGKRQFDPHQAFRPIGRRRRLPRARRSGMVLFIVVIFVAMLSLAGLSYVAVMSTEHKAVRLRGDELQVEMAVGSGVEMIRAHLQQKSEPPSTASLASQPLSSESRFRGVVVMDDETGRRTRFSVISPKMENDQVTFRLAKSDDLWFHALGVPGAHVIVRRGGQEVPSATIGRAAELAAYFSPLREEADVIVVYTERRHVRRVPGAAPGLVTYRHEGTIRVQPKGPSPREVED